MTSADTVTAAIQRSADIILGFIRGGWTLEQARSHTKERSALGPASWARIDAIVEAALKSTGQV